MFDLPASKVFFWHEDSIVGTIEIGKLLDNKMDSITLTDLEGIIVVEVSQ